MVYAGRFDFLPDSQLVKSRPRIKNFLPIWTIGMRSSSMILRKWRIENPAISAAVGISRNILMRVVALGEVSVIIVSVLPFADILSTWLAIAHLLWLLLNESCTEP